MHESLSIPYETHVLPNGLEVVIHEDQSDPVVAASQSGRQKSSANG
jgi:hypothetical protein